jgi:arsenate reductase-like glutaredoxin family protein
LKEWSNHFGWENILNKKGTTFCKLSETEKISINTEEKVIIYLLENTSAIKRPIVEVKGKYLIRFDEQEYEEVLKK